MTTQVATSICLLAVWSALVCAQGIAQQTTQSPPAATSASAPANCTPPTVEEVRRWMDLSGPNLATETVDFLAKLRPNLSPDLLKRMEQSISKFNEQAEAATIPAVQQHFCSEDLKQAIAFWESPVGRKFRMEMPVVKKESRAEVALHYAAMVAELNQLATEESTQGSTSGEQANPSSTSSITPSPQSNAQTPDVKRITVTQEASQGLLIHIVQLTYPPLARQARVQGTVELKALIDKDGTIEKLELVSGHPVLVAAAIEAVKQWRYKPYIYEGQAVKVETTITVNFELTEISGPSPR